MLQIHPSLFPTSLSQTFIFTDLHCYHQYAAPSEDVERGVCVCVEERMTAMQEMNNLATLSVKQIWEQSRGSYIMQEICLSEIQTKVLSWRIIICSDSIFSQAQAVKKDFILDAWDLACLFLNPRAGVAFGLYWESSYLHAATSSSIHLIEQSRHFPPIFISSLIYFFYKFSKWGRQKKKKKDLEKI